MELRRVTIDVQPSDVPELMNRLGNFATSKDVRVRFSDVSQEIAETRDIAEDVEDYNPALVERISDRRGGKQLGITTNKLGDFAEATLGRRPLAVRLLNSFSYNKGPICSNLETLDRYSFETFESKQHYYPKRAMKPETAQELFDKLETEKLWLPNVGVATMQLFEVVCDQLYTK